LAALSCNQSNTKKNKMEKVKIIEMVMWKSVDGISAEEAKKSATKLNEFISQQPGFIARKTALAEDGKFLDLVYWTDLTSAKVASEKAMKNEGLIPIFSTMDQNEMIFQHFKVFNWIEK